MSSQLGSSPRSPGPWRAIHPVLCRRQLYPCETDWNMASGLLQKGFSRLCANWCNFRLPLGDIRRIAPSTRLLFWLCSLTSFMPTRSWVFVRHRQNSKSRQLKLALSCRHKLERWSPSCCSLNPVTATLPT